MICFQKLASVSRLILQDYFHLCLSDITIMEHRDRAKAVVTGDPVQHEIGYPMQHETVVTGYPISAPPAEYYYQTHNAPSSDQSLSINSTSTSTTTTTTTSASVDTRRWNNHCRKYIVPLIIIISIPLLCMVLLTIINWKFHTPEFSVISVTVDPLNISSSSHDITSDWRVSFSISNVNEQKVHYTNIQTSIMFKNETMCSGTMENFSLDTCHLDDDYCKSSGGLKKLLEHEMAASSVNVNQTVAKTLVNEREKGSVIFTFELNAGLAIDNGYRHKIRRQMVVSCDLEIGFVSSNSQAGKLWGAPVQCNVRL